MSIEKAAGFWLRNICNFPADELKEKMGKDSDSIVNGLAELREILKTIYSDYISYEVENDEQSYDNLIYTVRFLYAIGKSGILKNDGINNYLSIDKSKFIFKNEYVSKKPPVFQYEILPKYGFIIKYYKDKTETSSVNSCDTFNIYYNNCSELLPALSYLINNIPDLNYEVDYVKSETLFLIADYNSIFLNKSTKRKDIDPLDYRIISMAGIYSKFWIQIIQSFTKTFDIKCNLYERYMSSFGSPTWEINFRKNKAVVFNAYIKADRIDISLKLTTGQINEALKLKVSLLPYIFQNLEAALSKKGKFIDIKIESQQEVDSVFEIINNILN